MEINFNQIVFDIESGCAVKHPYKQKTEGPTPAYPQGRIIDEGPDLTLGSACIFPLHHTDKDENGKPLDYQTSMSFHIMAANIQEAMDKGNPLELKAKDIVLLSTLLATAYKPVIAGPCLLMLEGKKPYRRPFDPELLLRKSEE